MPTPLLSIKNLRISFKHEKEWVEAVHGIDLEVFAGRTLGLVGESGSGKSMTAMDADYNSIYIRSSMRM